MLKTNKCSPLVYLGALLISLFPIAGLTTPAGVHVTSAKTLDKPGLLLVDFVVVWPYGIPGEDIVTNKITKHTYRVYCPTGMVRDVTNGKWGNAVSGWNNHLIGAGVFTQVFYQVCPEHHDRIISILEDQAE